MANFSNPQQTTASNNNQDTNAGNPSQLASMSNQVVNDIKTIAAISQNENVRKLAAEAARLGGEKAVSTIREIDTPEEVIETTGKVARWVGLGVLKTLKDTSNALGITDVVEGSLIDTPKALFKGDISKVRDIAKNKILAGIITFGKEMIGIAEWEKAKQAKEEGKPWKMMWHGTLALTSPISLGSVAIVRNMLTKSVSQKIAKEAFEALATKAASEIAEKVNEKIASEVAEKGIKEFTETALRESGELLAKESAQELRKMLAERGVKEGMSMAQVRKLIPDDEIVDLVSGKSEIIVGKLLDKANYSKLVEEVTKEHLDTILAMQNNPVELANFIREAGFKGSDPLKAGRAVIDIIKKGQLNKEITEMYTDKVTEKVYNKLFIEKQGSLRALRESFEARWDKEVDEIIEEMKLDPKLKEHWKKLGKKGFEKGAKKAIRKRTRRAIEAAFKKKNRKMRRKLKPDIDINITIKSKKKDSMNKSSGVDLYMDDMEDKGFKGIKIEKYSKGQYLDTARNSDSRELKVSDEINKRYSEFNGKKVIEEERQRLNRLFHKSNDGEIKENTTNRNESLFSDERLNRELKEEVNKLEQKELVLANKD